MVAYSKAKFVVDVRHLTITFKETRKFGHYFVVLMQLTSNLVIRRYRNTDKLVRHLMSGQDRAKHGLALIRTMDGVRIYATGKGLDRRRAGDRNDRPSLPAQRRTTMGFRPSPAGSARAASCASARDSKGPPYRRLTLPERTISTARSTPACLSFSPISSALPSRP